MPNKIRFLMISGICDNDAYDIVCFQNTAAYEAFKAHAATHGWISYINIPLELARKAVGGLSGVGIGCYLPDVHEALTRARRSIADMKMIKLCKALGHVQLIDPYQFDIGTNEQNNVHVLRDEMIFNQE